MERIPILKVFLFGSLGNVVLIPALDSFPIHNMGVAGQTQLLEHVSQPVAEGEQRWLDGLYLDVPEEWDDPYRFFRW